MSSILSQPQPPAAPIAARTVRPMGEDEMPEPKKRRGRPPKNPDAAAPKKRRRRRRGPYAKLADRVAKAPSGNPLAQHVRTTFETLEAVLDIDGCDPVVHSAFRAHKEALGLLAG